MCFVSIKQYEQFGLVQNLEMHRLWSISNTEMFLLPFFKENPFAQWGYLVLKTVPATLYKNKKQYINSF